MRDFLEKHFDKLFLGMLLLLGCVFLIHVYAHAPDHSQWVENLVGQILAALLTLMVGARNFMRASDNGGTNGKTNGTGPNSTAGTVTPNSGVRGPQEPQPLPGANLGG